MISPAEVGLAFVEGLALIASPCILPVLPLVLSGGVSGGKARPFGITLGFVVAFSIFVLLSRQIVSAFHIAPDTLRIASMVLLFGFGIVLLFDGLSQKFSALTQGLADFGSRANANAEGGFGSGILIGALIGFVWTPCAGPILAAVLVQVIRQETDAQGVAVTLAFAVGASLPMLALTLAGKKLMKNFRAFSKHAELMRKAFAVLILLSVGFIAFQSNASSFLDKFTSKFTGATTVSGGFQDGLDKPYPAPDFAGIEQWLNSQPLTMQKLRGKVVLLDFWTYSCINCVRTLPYVTTWDKKYRDQGLVIIGVHSPEFEFEKDVNNIKNAISKYGIEYPVAVDSHLSTWVAFSNKYWPAHYLIDKNGNVVYTHFGEGKYDTTENNIRALLGIKDAAASNPQMSPVLQDETPETYLGYTRADRFLALSQLQKNMVFGYMPVNFVERHHWSLGGLWRVESDKIVSKEKDAYLRFNFKAKKVFLVMGTDDGKPRHVSIKLNGAPLAMDVAGEDVTKDVIHGVAAEVKGHRLYSLVNQKMPYNGLLEITADEPGVEMYAFTFGE